MVLNGQLSSAIYQYNPKTNSWLDLVSNTPTARWRSLVAVLPTNEMMIVGGAIDYINFILRAMKLKLLTLICPKRTYIIIIIAKQ